MRKYRLFRTKVRIFIRHATTPELHVYLKIDMLIYSVTVGEKSRYNILDQKFKVFDQTRDYPWHHVIKL